MKTRVQRETCAIHGSAGWQPAVARMADVQAPADWQSAIRQIGNLRYGHASADFPSTPLRVSNPRRTGAPTAFTLVEVMIALGIFFMAMFAILGLVATSLRSARALQRQPVDAGIVAAEISLTNRLTEGLETGDFGDLHRGYEWSRDIYEVGTNGLFQVDMIVQRRSDGAVESKLSILLFRPESPQGSLSRGRLQ